MTREYTSHVFRFFTETLQMGHLPEEERVAKDVLNESEGLFTVRG